MRKEIEEYIKHLHQAAIDSRKDAEEAFKKGDLGLSGFHRGEYHTLEGIAIVLEDILGDYKEEEQ
ncbi:glyoxalase [Bacillus sp. FSL R12-0069]|uniref:glyoxalase n=1 Tax=Bacillus sp. FSL R12-0069 TaxID=2975342 RepID=UPI0030FB7840